MAGPSSRPQRGKRIGDDGNARARTPVGFSVNAMPSKHVALLAHEIWALMTLRRDIRCPVWVTGGKPPSEHMFSELQRVADIVPPVDSLNVGKNGTFGSKV